MFALFAAKPSNKRQNIADIISWKVIFLTRYNIFIMKSNLACYVTNKSYILTDQPRPILFLFHRKHLYRKTVDYCGIRTQIVSAEGKHADR